MSNTSFDFSDFVDFNESKANTTIDCFKEYLGKPVAVLCVRFCYRGIMKIVNEDSIVLVKARAVSTTGDCSKEEPESEEEILSPVIIMRSAIELVYQPRWCFAPL